MIDNAVSRRRRALEYLGKRTGTYEFRCLRYAAVVEVLHELDLLHTDIVVDVGAGMCDFDRYLRQTAGFQGRYLPVDASISGTDLNIWVPPVEYDFFVAIETMEHLRDPSMVLRRLKAAAQKGVVLTTPNPDTVDVLGIDETHISPITEEMLREWGFVVRPLQAFNKPADTLLAHWHRR